jgi:hypothetical protein
MDLPTFLTQLSDPAIKNVLLCGCGGGFDFVHSLVLYPALRSMGKNIVIGSYSFGNPAEIRGNVRTVYHSGGAVAVRVTAASKPDPYYCPEVHVCSFLDAQYPDTAPHFVYAYYARAFAIPTLKPLYEQYVSEHSIDAVVLFDGGSDSLMAGDEEGLGDPAEDAVSVATVAALDNVKLKLLLCIGLGADRFNHVSDASTLRAIAELTEMDGFRGAMSLEQRHVGLKFYRDCIHHIYERQEFQSVIAGSILAAADGHTGDEIPLLLAGRVKPGKLFIWTLMAMLWAFDVETVARRSMMVDWIQHCRTHMECLVEIHSRRSQAGIRAVENLPRHEDVRYQTSYS